MSVTGNIYIKRNANPIDRSYALNWYFVASDAINRIAKMRYYKKKLTKVI